MKKSKVLYSIAAVLVLVFLVKTGVDWHTYNTTLNSAPFRLWILVNAIYFLLPAAVLAVIGFLKKES